MNTIAKSYLFDNPKITDYTLSMTEIPGTGKIPVPSKTEPIKPSDIQTISAVNVHEMKEKKKNKYIPPASEENWYNRAAYWALFGLIGGLAIASLSISRWQFLLFIPIGPVVGVIAWFIRRYAKRFEKGSETLFEK
jgi:hypothetical protein